MEGGTEEEEVQEWEFKKSGEEEEGREVRHNMDVRYRCRVTARQYGRVNGNARALQDGLHDVSVFISSNFVCLFVFLVLLLL